MENTKDKKKNDLFNKINLILIIKQILNIFFSKFYITNILINKNGPST